jgi:hypothetical protein
MVLSHTSKIDKIFGTYTYNIVIATYATFRYTFATSR